jgi:hypothetical protein
MAHREISSSSESDRGEGPSQGGSGAKRLDVTRDEARKAAREAAQQEAQWRYRASDKGQETLRKYRASDERRAAARKYRASDGGREQSEIDHRIQQWNKEASRYGQERPLSKGEEKNIKRSVKKSDRRPGQEGMLLPGVALPEGGDGPLQYNSPNTVRSTLQTLQRRGRLDPGQEKVQMMERELGEVSSESEDSRDRGYNEPPPEMRK